MRTKMLKALLLTPLIVLSTQAQDLFLKLDSYSLQPNARAVARLLQGTFAGNESTVTLGQYDGISLHGPVFSGPAVESISLQTDKKKTTIEVQALGPGTYLFGLSTVPKVIDQKAADFNEFLRRVGLTDILAQRTKNNELMKHVRLRYGNNVRTVFQVAAKLSDHYNRKLNFPVELLPQQNPYSLKVGQSIAVLCLVNNRPVANQVVLAGWESRDGKIQTSSAHTGSDGIASFKLLGNGKWYVKMVHMKPLTEPNVNYEVESATLTFEVRK